jgi:competence protein ComEC
MAAVWPFFAGLRPFLGASTESKSPLWLHNSIAAQHGTFPLWLAVAFLSGIGLHFQLPWQHQREAALFLIGVISAILLLACLWRPSALYRQRFMILTLGLGLGMFVAEARERAVTVPKLDYPRSVTLVAEVIDIAGEKLYLRPIASDRELPRLKVVRVSVRGLKAKLVPGDRLKIRARLSPPAGPVSPGGYNFARVAWFKQIGAVGISFGQPEIISRKIPSSFFGLFDWAREHAAQRFVSQLPGDTGDVAAALVVGERGDISPDIVQDLRISGLAHLLSVSGFHLVMVAGGLFWGTRHLLALSRRLALVLPIKSIAASVAILGSLGYTLLTGAAYPTQRAMIAIAIAMLAIMIGRSAISLRLLAIVAIILLGFRPEALLDVSFQLSFTGVAALIAFYDLPRVKAFLKIDGQTSWRLRIGKSLLSTMMATLVAEIALAPIAIGQFHQLGIYGLIANAIGVPLTAFVLMPLGFLSLALQPIGLDSLINPIFGFSIDAFLRLGQWAASLPHAQVRVTEIGSLSFVLLMYGLIIFMISKQHLRLLGIVFALAGFIMAFANPKPLVRIAPEGNIVAALTDDGALSFPTLKRGRFARKAWMEENAQFLDTTWDSAGAPACVADVCVFKLAHSENKLLYFGPSADPESCIVADILVDMRYERHHWCSAPIYIDKRVLGKTGAIHVFVSNGRLKLVTANGIQGDHLWVPRSGK